MSTLPNIKLVRSLMGEAYIQDLDTGLWNSAGHIESVDTSVDVTPDDVFSGIGGARTLSDTEVREVRVTGTAVFRETGTRQLALALMANEALFTQDAQTGLIASGEAKAGNILDLGLGATITTITDGTNPLVSGVGNDYTFDPATGHVQFLEDTEYDVVYARTAFTANDGLDYLAALSASQGRVARMRVVQKQSRGDDNRMWTALVRIRPNGPVQHHNDNGDKVTLPVAFDVLEDTSMPVGQRHGVLVRLPSQPV